MTEISVAKEFGTSFEEKIITAVLEDDKFAEQIVEVLEPEYFELECAKEISKIIKEYFYKYNSFPTVDLLQTLCKQEITNKVLLVLCEKYLNKIRITPLNGDSQYVKENSLKYFKTQHLRNVLVSDVLPKIKAANFEEIVPIIEKAVQKGTDRNIGYDYNEDTELRFKDEQFSVIPTPWKYLNGLLNGGWGAGRLATIIGSAGSGKSMMLVNVGCGALKAGKTVVHYTLELSDIDVARRYDANLTDVEINHITKNKDIILSSLKRILPNGARLIIKEYPMKGATIQTLRSHLAKLKLMGIEPDLILTDYWDLFKALELHKESRHSLEAIGRDHKALAQELKIPIITATQTNRTGYNSDLITPDQISEDFSKVMTSDIILTMARNMEQKTLGMGKMYLAKNRQGEDGQIFAYDINTKKAKISCYELTKDIEEKLNEAFEQSKEQQLKGDVKDGHKIVNKYKKEE